MILQLNPILPVHILEKGDGLAIAMIDYSQEHDLLFVVAITETGEILTVDNNQVRMLKNITMERKIEQEQKENNNTKKLWIAIAKESDDDGDYSTCSYSYTTLDKLTEDGNRYSNSDYHQIQVEIPCQN